jgi:hypothetical protein
VLSDRRLSPFKHAFNRFNYDGLAAFNSMVAGRQLVSVGFNHNNFLITKKRVIEWSVALVISIVAIFECPRCYELRTKPHQKTTAVQVRAERYSHSPCTGTCRCRICSYTDNSTQAKIDEPTAVTAHFSSTSIIY